MELMGKPDLRTTELCAEKEGEREEQKALGENDDFNFIQYPMAEICQ